MGVGTPVGRVRGLGAGGDPTGHFWKQRMTAVSNIVVMIWFVVSLLRLPNLGYETVTNWLRSPLAAIPMLFLIASVFWHFRMGVQVWLEDYTHDEGNKVLSILALNFYTVAATVTAVFCVLKIAFSGVAGA